MDNISAWNAKIDKTSTVIRQGRQGILYEYILPYGANPMRYYEEAIDVKSRKTGFYGVVTDVDITPNKLFVKVKLMLNDREVEIPKSVLDYVTPEEWEFVKRMEERD